MILTAERRIWQGLLGMLLAFVVVAISSRGIGEMLLTALGPTVNYRRRPVAFPGGLILLIGTAVAPILLGACIGIDGDQQGRFGAYLLLTLGFALVGFVDDMLGGHAQSGFGGHLGALRQGIFTTGMFKVLVGAAISLGAVELLGTGIAGIRAFLDAGLVALSANFINLLDRRPGRAIKGFLLGFAVLAIWFWSQERGLGLGRLLIPAGSALGAAIAFLPADLGERVMLGDTGSNLLGAALGYGAVQMAPGWRTLLLAVLIWLTLASEKRSFGEVIDGNRLLRFIDDLGRLE